MKRYRMGNFVSQGIAGVFRNPLMSSAAIFVLASTLLIMGSFAALIINIDFNLDSIDDFNEIVCYLELDADTEMVKKVGQEIAALDNIESITFITKEEALEAEKKKYGEDHLYLLDYGEDTNPLPHTFRISYKDINKVDVLIYALENIEGVESTSSRIDIANKIDSIKQAISVVCACLMLMLLVVSFFVISNTVRLAFQLREKEISIMRYIGATKYYITMPFVIEGLIIGLAASVLAYLIQWYAYTYLSGLITNAYSIVNVVPYSENATAFLYGFLIIGVSVSVFGCSISARRYMKV